jgi:hypothetical protein
MNKTSKSSSYSKMISNTTAQHKTNYHYLPLKARLSQLFKTR